MLGQFFGTLPRSAKKSTDGVSVDVGALLPERKDYFLYEGSMTTPGCPQGVRWFVMEQSVEASQAQIDLFIDDLTQGDTNNRPVQSTYGRIIIKGH
jgi:carbonic anhydrase